jgi:hypothetical protein
VVNPDGTKGRRAIARARIQAARFFRVIAKDRRALVIAATLLSPGQGCRDGWTITVNADVSFAPTVGADCPISSIIGQPCDELSDTAADG